MKLYCVTLLLFEIDLHTHIITMINRMSIAEASGALCHSTQAEKLCQLDSSLYIAKLVNVSFWGPSVSSNPQKVSSPATQCYIICEEFSFKNTLNELNTCGTKWNRWLLIFQKCDLLHRRYSEACINDDESTENMRIGSCWLLWYNYILIEYLYSSLYCK